jgi:hypothetical protein
MPPSSGFKSRKNKGGRKPWTTPEQLEWLEKELSAYLTLRTNKERLRVFWIILYDGWFEHWPVGPGTLNVQDQELVCVVVQSGPELIDCPL